MFQLYKGKTNIDRESIDNEEILKLLDLLIKDKKEKDAIKILMFIFLSVDRSEENPIRDLLISDRPSEARLIAFGSKSFDIKKKYSKYYEDIRGAMISYKEGNKDSVQDDIDLYNKKMEQFITLLDENEPEIVRNTNELTGKVSFATNIDIINTVLENSINIILDKSALVKMKKTGKFQGGLRGTLSPNMGGKIKTTLKID